MNDRDRSCCADPNAWNVIAVIVSFFISPALGVFFLAMWIWGAAVSAPRQKPPLTADEKAEHDAEFLRQDAERHRLWVETQKTLARAAEIEDELRQYAP